MGRKPPKVNEKLKLIAEIRWYNKNDNDKIIFGYIYRYGYR